MSFSELYERVQEKEPKIKTKWLRDQVIDLTHITGIREQWTGAMDGTAIRGFYVEGPLGPPVPRDENEALIVLARSLDKPWRRFIYTKELMHAFDTDEEKTDTPEKFDAQIKRFGDPAADNSAQFRSEVVAFWRALAVLCPEKTRLEMKAELDANEMTLEVAATRLVIPQQRAEDLFRDDYLMISGHIQK